LRRYQEAPKYRELSENQRMEAEFRQKIDRSRLLGLPRVEGFDKSGVMTDEEVKGFVKGSFPEHHANNITMDSIKYSDSHETNPERPGSGQLQKQEVAQGADLIHKDIVINPDNLDGKAGAEGFKSAIAREVGHRVYDVNLSGEARRDWETLSWNRPRERCVSDLAQASADRDFAESYRAYRFEPESLKRTSPEKYDFMKTHVFDSHEFTAFPGKTSDAVRFGEAIESRIRNPEEARIYREIGLKETTVNSRPALTRDDIEPDIVDDFGRTNIERMKEGLAPLDKNGDTYELHHIGQEQDSPLAELRFEEHRGAENFTKLHVHQESHIDRSAFESERAEHWKQRADEIARNQHGKN